MVAMAREIWPGEYDALKRGWKKIRWEEFCVWLAGRRVLSSREYDDTQLFFTDGTTATMVSQKTEGSPHYSELTPGSDGHLTTPAVWIWEGT